MDRQGFRVEHAHRIGHLPDGRLALLAVDGDSYLFAWESPNSIQRDYSANERGRCLIVNPLPPFSPEEGKKWLDFLLRGVSWEEVLDRVRSDQAETERRKRELDHDILDYLSNSDATS